MSFLIGRYEFEGPLVNWRGVKNQAGIYAIMSYSNQAFELVELAEADDLQEALLDHENQDHWQSKSLGMLTFSVFYHDRASKGRREEIVGEILREFGGECSYREPSKILAAAAAGPSFLVSASWN